MPIRPENVHRYPPEWPQIRARILSRAGNACERCGVSNYALGGRSRTGTFLPAAPKGEKLLGLDWPKPGEESFCGYGEALERLRIIRIVLTVAHLNHTPEDCRDENLLALCQRCHLALDIDHHKATAYRTRREGRAAADLFEGDEST
jgi:hypothetical protein